MNPRKIVLSPLKALRIRIRKARPGGLLHQANRIMLGRRMEWAAKKAERIMTKAISEHRKMTGGEIGKAMAAYATSVALCERVILELNRSYRARKDTQTLKLIQVYRENLRELENDQSKMAELLGERIFEHFKREDFHFDE